MDGKFRVCKKCKKRKHMDRPARWFCGSLYVKDGEQPEQEFRGRVCNTPGLLYAEWSLEKGKENEGLHYQFRLEIDGKGGVRRSHVRKGIDNFVKGEWIEPICCMRAQEAYVRKADTHVAGPWEINNRKTAAPGVKESVDGSRLLHRPQAGVSEAMDRRLMKDLLAEKWKEILMWSDFIEKGNVTLGGAEEQ